MSTGNLLTSVGELVNAGLDLGLSLLLGDELAELGLNDR